MTALNKQALREAVQKATQGEWLLEYGEDSFNGDNAMIQREVQGFLPVAIIEGAHPESGFDADFQQEQQANAEFIAAANPATVLALLDELESAEKRIAEQSVIVAAAEKLVRCKGRYHSELNYRSLAKLFGVTTPDLPPLEHENVHYADAAEMEIAALRQRINELEARTVNLPKRSVGEVMHMSGFSRDYAEGWCAGNDNAIHEIRAAGIGVKGD